MASLKKLESRIEDNIKKAWYENGLCLREIQQDKLYPKKFKTFEAYLIERWSYTDSYVYKLINSASAYQILEEQKVDKNGVFVQSELPKNEGQVRPLLSLDNASEQVHVWREVVESGEKITGATVKRFVDEFIAHPVDVKEVEAQEKNTNVTSSKKEVLYASGNNDECYTPDYAVKALLEHLPKNKIIWCPFDKEDSQFVIQLQDAGFTVTHSHIDTGQDFYSYEPEQWDLIVSNPPFTGKRKIFERALSFGKPFALIMSNTWLNDAAPKQIFKERGLQLLMFEERMKFLNQDNSFNKITFSSSYFCCGLLKRDITMRSLKDYGY